MAENMIGELVLGVRVQLADYQRQLLGAQQQTTQAATGMTAALQTIQKAFTMLAGAYGVRMLVREIIKAAKVTAEFEQAIANAASVSGSTRKELSDLARELGKNTVYSAKEAADAEYYLASAGLKVEEMAKVLPGVLNLAAGTQYDLASATDTVLASLNMFGLGMEQTDRVVNVFAAGISTSQATMDKLAASMRFAGPIASQVGMSIEGTVAVLDKLYDAGYRGEQAGTILRGAFTQLLAPSQEALKIFQREGIALRDLQNALKDPVKLVDLLRKANLSAADSATVFGARALGFTTILKGGSEALQKHIDAITGTKKADQLAAEQIDTLKGSLKLLKSAFEDFQLTLGTKVVPGLRSYVDELRTTVNWVNRWAQASEKGSTQAQSYVDTLLNMQGATSETTRQFSLFMDRFQKAQDVIANAPQGTIFKGAERMGAESALRTLRGEFAAFAREVGIARLPVDDYFKAWTDGAGRAKVTTKELQVEAAKTKQLVEDETAAQLEADLKEIDSENAKVTAENATKNLQAEEDQMRADFKLQREAEAEIARQEMLVTSLEEQGLVEEAYYARLDLMRLKDLAAESNAIRLRTRGNELVRTGEIALAKQTANEKMKLSKQEYDTRIAMLKTVGQFVIDNAFQEKATLGSVAAAGLRAFGQMVSQKALMQAAYYGAEALATLDPGDAAAAAAMLALAGTAKLISGAAASSIEASAKAGKKAFAYGGLVTGPTSAMIGERGPELVLPPEITRDFLSGQRAGAVSNNYGNNDISVYVTGGEGADTGRQVAEQLDVYFARLGVRVARETR